MLFRLIKREIERGKTTGLRRKIEVFYLAGSLTEDEFNELTSMLPA